MGAGPVAARLHRLVGAGQHDADLAPAVDDQALVEVGAGGLAGHLDDLDRAVVRDGADAVGQHLLEAGEQRVALFLGGRARLLADGPGAAELLGEAQPEAHAALLEDHRPVAQREVGEAVGVGVGRILARQQELALGQQLALGRRRPGAHAQVVGRVELEPLRRLGLHRRRCHGARAAAPGDLHRLVAVEHRLQRLADQALHVQVGQHVLDGAGHAAAGLAAVQAPLQRLHGRLAPADAGADMRVTRQVAVDRHILAQLLQQRVRVGQDQAERVEVQRPHAGGDVGAGQGGAAGGDEVGHGGRRGSVSSRAG